MSKSVITTRTIENPLIDCLSYEKVGETAYTIANHAVNAVFKLKRKAGSELPLEWSKWDEIVNECKEQDEYFPEQYEADNNDVITWKTASGWVDSISRDDLLQIAVEAIIMNKYSAQFSDPFEIAFVAIRRQFGQTQYNVWGRYQPRLKSRSKIAKELEEKGLIQESKAVKKEKEKIAVICEKYGLDPIDRTTGPVYRQGVLMENEQYEQLQTRIYKTEKEQYITSHMKPELRKIYEAYKNGFESVEIDETEKAEASLSYYRKKLNYGDSITRDTLYRRIRQMKEQFRTFAKEYDDFIKEVEYSNNYKLGLTKADSTKESVTYLAYLAKKAKKARKNEIKRVKYTVCDDYIAEQAKAHEDYIYRCNPVENVAEAAETYKSQFKPAKRYSTPQITSISDVKDWSPKAERKTEVIPYEVLEKALKSEKTSKSSKVDIYHYIGKYYPNKALQLRFELEGEAENILSEVVFDSSK